MPRHLGAVSPGPEWRCKACLDNFWRLSIHQHCRNPYRPWEGRSLVDDTYGTDTL